MAPRRGFSFRASFYNYTIRRNLISILISLYSEHVGLDFSSPTPTLLNALNALHRCLPRGLAPIILHLIASSNLEFDIGPNRLTLRRSSTHGYHGLPRWPLKNYPLTYGAGNCGCVVGDWILCEWLSYFCVWLPHYGALAPLSLDGRLRLSGTQYYEYCQVFQHSRIRFMYASQSYGTARPIWIRLENISNLLSWLDYCFHFVKGTDCWGFFLVIDQASVWKSCYMW